MPNSDTKPSILGQRWHVESGFIRHEIRAEDGRNLGEMGSATIAAHIVQLHNAELDKAGKDIYAEIAAERVRQDAQWGGPEHDDQHNTGDWRSFREVFDHRAVWSDFKGKPFRDFIVKIAALAVAQIESLDRQEKAK